MHRIAPWAFAAVAAAVVAAAGVAGWYAGGPTTAATAMGIVTAVGGTFVSALAWARRQWPQPAHLSSDEEGRLLHGLANAVTEQWGAEIRLWELDTHRIAVPWQVRAPDGSGSAHRWRPVDDREAAARTAGPAHGTAGLAAWFLALAHRRIALVGEGGTGKTTLAVLLVRELLERRGSDSGLPVPVLLTLNRWDRGQESIHTWIAGRLREDYPSLHRREHSGLAESLLARGRILPVLDGLDELEPADRSRVSESLTRMTRNDPLILTCRPEEFATDQPTLYRTLDAVVVPDPIPAEGVRASLTSRLAPCDRERWARVLEHLRTTPEGPLARALSTALALWMLHAAYVRTRRDPEPLLEYRSEARIREHLLDDLLPALLSERVDPGGPGSPRSAFRARRKWTAAKATRWLGFLAEDFGYNDYRSRDLAWWDLPSRKTSVWSRLVFAVGYGLLVGAALHPLLALQAASAHPWLTFALPAGGAAALVMSLLSAYRFASFRPTLRIVNVSGLPRSLARHGPFLVLAGLALGVVTAAAVARPGGAHVLWVAVLLGVLAWGVPWLLHRAGDSVGHPPTAATPVGELRANRRSVLTWWISGALALALAAWFFTRHHADYPGWVNLPAALLLWPLWLHPVRWNAWGPFVVVRAQLAAGGRVPWRLMGFLADMHRVGLLRQVGGVYQFRHAELHDRLAARYREQHHADQAVVQGLGSGRFSPTEVQELRAFAESHLPGGLTAEDWRHFSRSLHIRVLLGRTLVASLATAPRSGRLGGEHRTVRYGHCLVVDPDSPDVSAVVAAVLSTLRSTTSPATVPVLLVERGGLGPVLAEHGCVAWRGTLTWVVPGFGTVGAENGQVWLCNPETAKGIEKARGDVALRAEHLTNLPVAGSQWLSEWRSLP